MSLPTVWKAGLEVKDGLPNVWKAGLEAKDAVTNDGNGIFGFHPSSRRATAGWMRAANRLGCHAHKAVMKYTAPAATPMAST